MKLRDYESIVGRDVIDELCLIAEKLKGKKIQNINFSRSRKKSITRSTEKKKRLLPRNVNTFLKSTSGIKMSCGLRPTSFSSTIHSPRRSSVTKKSSENAGCGAATLTFRSPIRKSGVLSVPSWKTMMEVSFQPRAFRFRFPLDNFSSHLPLIP